MISEDISEKDVERELGKEEAAVQKATGRGPLHSTSASAFLAMGLELEESQSVMDCQSFQMTSLTNSLVFIGDV